MPHPSAPELLVLTALRVTSFAPVERVAAAAGQPVDVVEGHLDDLLARELVKHRSGVITGWLLTPAGRVEGERQLAAELDATGTRDAVRAAYEQFLALNGELLQVCTDWQLVGGTESHQLNEHLDPAYDATVVGRLAALHDKARTVTVALAAALDRYGAYESRLATALARVQAGPGGGDDWADWFTKPTIDSYHTVWFELHENLLATLGIERSSEAQH